MEYTDASGKLKFNKRPVSSLPGGGGKGGEVKKDKKAKRKRLAKLNNAKLLSFGDDDG